MIERSFFPGSEWLFFKLYTGPKSADELLTAYIGPFAASLQADGMIDGCFFIRYTDPDFHLRVRLHIPRIESYGEVFSRFYRSFLPAVRCGLISRVVCDTYVREVERYGEATMQALENLFCCDSTFVIRLLEQLGGLPVTEREEMRWKLSVMLLDDALFAFAGELASRQKQISGMAENFKKEFGFTVSAYNRQLNDKFRLHRKEVASAMQKKDVPAPIREVLEARREAFATAASEIRNLQASAGAEQPEYLLSSILHMTMNRWFRTRNRLHELVVYDFLNRHYESELARAKYAK